MIQKYNLKKCFRIFVEKSEKALKSELRQLHDMETFIPRETKKIPKKDWMEALSLIMSLVKNSDVIIKGRACSDGSKHRIDINKKDEASPTVTQ